jgi:hypothetical protein
MKKDPTIDVLSDITVFTKYARFQKDLQRRETWTEIVDRNKEMHQKKYPSLKDEIEDAYQYVYDKKVLPSMRSMQFGGKPIEISPNRIYNCAYLPIDDWRAFGETMFLLLGGTGVGYSVQKHHVDKLPEIRKPRTDRVKRFLISDNIEGWADAIKALMKSYFRGTSTLHFDYSDIREKGAELVTSGGKAPGPDPLKACLMNINSLLSNKKDGNKLNPIEVHDIVCYIADAVLAGGIRRAALISLFSATDKDMIVSKGKFTIHNWEYAYTDGPVDINGEPTKVMAEHVDQTGKKYYDLNVKYSQPYYNGGETTLYWVSEDDIKNHLETNNVLPWYYFQAQRGRANNSVVLVRSRINKRKFMDLWKTVEESGAGEPGFYYTNDKDWGTNPCCEIGLRPYQFCNLCEVNVSDVESQEDLNNRSKAAAFIGTLQAGYTDFHYLRDVWRKTTEKDALIGVGMTGIGSGHVLKYDMEQAAEQVKSENSRVAKIIGIKDAARTTTVKPSGTSSLVVGSSSGIHAWHNDFYLRRMRIGKNEAIYPYLESQFPDLVEDDFFSPKTTGILGIPQKAPDGAILRTESAMDLLERVKTVAREWVKPGHRDGMNTHNISATVSVKSSEWEEVGEWMWKNREYYNGLSVLPYDGGTYKQAPFEDITESQFNDLKNKMHGIDLTKVGEANDNTDLKGEIACAGGACEIV